LSFSADRPAFPPTIGPYRITAVLGEGGMGVVYAAEQTAPIQRRIAVKVIRGGSGAADADELVTFFVQPEHQGKVT
jgi:serine/threonine protein kinase